MISTYRENELTLILKLLLSEYKNKDLQLLTVTAHVVAKNKAVDLHLHYGVDGYEWE